MVEVVFNLDSTLIQALSLTQTELAFFTYAWLISKFKLALKPDLSFFNFWNSFITFRIWDLVEQFDGSTGIVLISILVRMLARTVSALYFCGNLYHIWKRDCESCSTVWNFGCHFLVGLCLLVGMKIRT